MTTPTSTIQTFDFRSMPVRVMGPAERPLFVAADVCRALELTNPTEALRFLEPDEKPTLSNPESRAGFGAQAFACVTESGLYALIFRSRKPKAREFRLWVTMEVLPQIRREGFYLTNTIDFEKYPVARNFQDLFNWLRGMGISPDEASNTARSLSWATAKRDAGAPASRTAARETSRDTRFQHKYGPEFLAKVTSWPMPWSKMCAAFGKAAGKDDYSTGKNIARSLRTQGLIEKNAELLWERSAK